MEHFPFYVVFNNALEPFPFDIADITQIRQVNREFLHLISDKNIIHIALRNNLPSLVACADTLGIDCFEDKILESDFNFLELSRIICVWVGLRERRFGEKYGFLLKQNMVRPQTSRNLIQNTLQVFRCLLHLSFLETNNQRHAPTDLPKYVMYWLSDYLHKVFVLVNPGYKCNVSYSDIVNDPTLLQKMFESKLDMYTTFECIIHSFDGDEIPFYIPNMKATCVTDLHNGLKIWCMLLDILSKYNQKTKIRCLFHIMHYLYLTCQQEGITENIELALRKTIKDKASEFVGSIDLAETSIPLKSLRDVSEKVGYLL
jgi:hypothetical protein